MVDPVSVLELVAEVSIGFVGFAGVIAAIRSTTETTRSDAIGMTLIVVNTFGVALGALVLLLLMSVGLDGQDLWMSASVAIALIFTISLVWLAVALRGSAALRKARLSLVFMFGIGSIITIANGLNAFGIVFRKEFGPVFAGGVWVLGLSAYNFATMLLRPMWRTVKKNEATRVAQHEDS